MGTKKKKKKAVCSKCGRKRVKAYRPRRRKAKTKAEALNDVPVSAGDLGFGD